MWVTTGYILITIITLYQRYTYKKHTLLQIGLGLVIGLAVGYITYVLSRKFIEGHVKMKEDDDAPL
jgi:lipoprotein signal peptidase